MVWFESHPPPPTEHAADCVTFGDAERRRVIVYAITAAKEKVELRPHANRGPSAEPVKRRGRSRGPSPGLTRATATSGWSSPRGQRLRTRPSTGSPRTRRHRISTAVCRTSSSCAGSTTADAVWRNSAANGRPASKTARGPCDRAARLK